ncbi:hypothetical protein V6N11_011320 [Hibiscus sabdariffa]|uniref:NAC domain-containing protein n=1 Tax=Hibiscus sabdariffa TaxID=183260 RepID=A0ABR2S7V8_9ROSI
MEMEIPVGFRFLPTDKELVIHYLINKVIYNPLSPSFFREINATEFYGKPPKSLDERNENLDELGGQCIIHLKS